MSDKQCPVCGNAAFPRLVKQNVTYYQCCNCKMIYSNPLDQEGKVGGGNEEPRNREQNQIRIDRVGGLFKKREHSEINVLDFGAGHGLLVKDLQIDGFNAEGYDPYNPEFSRLPKKDYFDAITCVETIEHTDAPYIEIDVIKRALKVGGGLMIETSFVDVAFQDGIDLEDFFYIDPSVGHSTIFSHHALDVLMVKKGFHIGPHWNRHVRFYIKAY